MRPHHLRFGRGRYVLWEALIPADTPGRRHCDANRMAPRSRVLLFSTLYPNAVRPGHGIFVETRLRHLLLSGEVEAKVLAPVPWFPFTHPRFGDYAAYARVPKFERREGIDVAHPRYISIPKVGMSAAPLLLAAAAAPAIRRLLAGGFDFDLLDAHYLYPDGVAAALLGRWFHKPVLMTARGSDVNILPRFALPRRMILSAARSAHAVVTVADALKRSLVELGVAREKITVLRNGVDLERFRPEDLADSRRELEVAGYCVACVGNLVPLKGMELVIEAIARIDDATLLVAGGGPLLEQLRARASALGVSSRVRFLGRLPQARLRTLYSAADALVLASSSEGWANVLLESMACGTPVIATAVGGSPEIVTSADAGLLLPERSVDAIVRALGRLRSAPPDRNAVRRHAEQFSWQATTQGQLSLFRRATCATTPRT